MQRNQRKNHDFGDDSDEELDVQMHQPLKVQDDAFGFSNLQINDHFGEEQKVTHYEERMLPNYMMGGGDGENEGVRSK